MDIVFIKELCIETVIESMTGKGRLNSLYASILNWELTLVMHQIVTLLMIQLITKRYLKH